MIELGLVDVRGDDDVVRAHQITRTIAAQLGFSTFEQTRIATAVSEIARNALTYAADGTVTFGSTTPGGVLARCWSGSRPIR
jgi:anti-sigma regulatory factor (Ser/Thr protein kinase)